MNNARIKLQNNAPQPSVDTNEVNVPDIRPETFSDVEPMLTAALDNQKNERPNSADQDSDTNDNGSEDQRKKEFYDKHSKLVGNVERAEKAMTLVGGAIVVAKLVTISPLKRIYKNLVSSHSKGLKKSLKLGTTSVVLGSFMSAGALPLISETAASSAPSNTNNSSSSSLAAEGRVINGNTLYSTCAEIFQDAGASNSSTVSKVNGQPVVKQEIGSEDLSVNSNDTSGNSSEFTDNATEGPLTDPTNIQATTYQIQERVCQDPILLAQLGMTLKNEIVSDNGQTLGQLNPGLFTPFSSVSSANSYVASVISTGNIPKDKINQAYQAWMNNEITAAKLDYLLAHLQNIGENSAALTNYLTQVGTLAIGKDPQIVQNSASNNVDGTDMAENDGYVATSKNSACEDKGIPNDSGQVEVIEVNVKTTGIGIEYVPCQVSVPVHVTSTPSSKTPTSTRITTPTPIPKPLTPTTTTYNEGKVEKTVDNTASLDVQPTTAQSSNQATSTGDTNNTATNTLQNADTSTNTTTQATVANGNVNTTATGSGAYTGDGDNSN